MIAGELILAAAMAAAAAEPAQAPASRQPPGVLAGYLLAPKAFRSSAETVMPAVVKIETSGGLLAPPPSPRPKRAEMPTAKAEPAKPGQPRPASPRRGMRGISGPGEGPTTGLIIASDGYIITSTYHFLRRPEVITVVLQDGTQHVARLLGRDETRKLCLLKIDPAENLPVPRFAPAGGLRVGQWVITVGVGYGGDEAALSTGIISALGRISRKAVQTDANISPANYGGPLVDLNGCVIGVCVPLSPYSESTAGGVEWYDSGIGFAIPLDGLDHIIQAMKTGKTIEPGRLGVVLQPGATGKDVVISAVVSGSPASQAGLEPKDVITAIEGQPVEDLRKFRGVLGRYVAGDTIKIAVRRGEKTLETKATLMAGHDLPAPAPAPSAGL
jgi:serine protease Do